MAVNKIKDKTGLSGQLCIYDTDAKTGEILNRDDDHNVILTQAPEQIFRAMSTKDVNIYTVKTIVLGNDVGTGTVVAPQPSTDGLDETDLNAVFEIPTGDFAVSYSGNTCTFAATIVGEDVMINFPTQPNVVYTSAILINENGKAIAYRRFSEGRTISAAINIQTFWTLTLNIN